MRNRSFAKKLRKLNKNSTKILLNEIGLCEENKELLYKRYVEEKSIIDISEELGYTKESTNVLIARSRKILEDIIIEQYELLPKNVRMIADFLYEL